MKDVSTGDHCSASSNLAAIGSSGHGQGRGLSFDGSNRRGTFRADRGGVPRDARVLSPDFLLTFEAGLIQRELERPQLERAIGVVYRPESERISHYFLVHLAEQFDAVIRLDGTRAPEPLERTPQWEKGEPPETFPTET